MGHQIIQQPDGRLCVFSSVVDDLIILDATRDELITLYGEQAAEDARRRTADIVDKIAAGRARSVYYQFTMSYEQALAACRSPR